MQRIMIIGPGSTGKSTLARALGALTELPVFHLDQHYWLQDWVARSDEEWRKRHHEIVQRDNWIIDGDFPEVMTERLERADTVIFLNLPRRVIIPAWFRRMYQYRGTNRPDMTPVNVETFNFAYLCWQLTYNRRAVVKLLNGLPADKSAFILNSRRKIDTLLKQF